MYGKAQGVGSGACLLLATSFLPGTRLPVIKTQPQCPLSGRLPGNPLHIAPSLSASRTRTALAPKGKACCLLSARRARHGARCLAASTPHWVLCVTCGQGVTGSVLPSSPGRLSRFSCEADGGAVSSGHGSSWLSTPPAQGVSASVSPSGSKAPKGGACVPEAVLTRGHIFEPLHLSSPRG